jgi:hypothetical protein
VPTPTEAFLADRTFKCEPLKARLTMENCVARQNIVLSPGGHQAPWNETPQNLYCVSGLCADGRMNQRIVQLRRKQ